MSNIRVEKNPSSVLIASNHSTKKGTSRPTFESTLVRNPTSVVSKDVVRLSEPSAT